MSENREAASTDPEQMTAAKCRARPAQRKLLILAIVLLVVVGGKIYYDRLDWWQVLQPPRGDGGPLLVPVTEEFQPIYLVQGSYDEVTDQSDDSSRGFRPVQVVPGPYEAITDAPIVSADEANELLGPAELVLGVVVDGKARAYPINMLTGPSREIINDTLGGRAIAATW